VLGSIHAVFLETLTAKGFAAVIEVTFKAVPD